MPRLAFAINKVYRIHMQRDVPATNWCRLANPKCYILFLQALAISKARLCDAVEMHTRILYCNSKSILARLFSIARLGSQTTMSSSIAPKHMSMHSGRLAEPRGHSCLRSAPQGGRLAAPRGHSCLRSAPQGHHGSIFITIIIISTLSSSKRKLNTGCRKQL